MARDVDSFHLEKQTHLKCGSVSILQQGPLRATLGASVNIGQSRMDFEVSDSVRYRRQWLISSYRFRSMPSLVGVAALK